MVKPKESAAVQISHKKAETTAKKNDSKAKSFPQKVTPVNVKKIELKKVETKQKILTEKEKQLENLATEKDWEEVDKDKDK